MHANSSRVARLILIFLLTYSVAVLSGCSQEPAPETLRSGKADYSYLSHAMESSDQDVKQEKIPTATTSNPIPKINTSNATPGQTTPDTARETLSPETVTPDTVNENNGAVSGPTPPDSGSSDVSDLELVEKYDRAIIRTSEGDITLKLYNDAAPKTVENFLKLARDHFYDGIRFHRVIKGFIIQAGDPNSKDDNWADDGMGGPGYTFGDEINGHKLIEGSIAMANSGPNTNGSQFFIVTAKSTPLLDGKYTNFGEVTDGLDVVRTIEKANTDKNDHPKENIEIENIEPLKKK